MQPYYQLLFSYSLATPGAFGVPIFSNAFAALKRTSGSCNNVIRAGLRIMWVAVIPCKAIQPSVYKLRSIWET